MNTIAVITPPATEPVFTTDLKDYLRINTTDEDGLLLGFISTAREQFEFRTGRPVKPTTYRQYLTTLAGEITLVRGCVTSITAVSYFDPFGTLTVASGYLSDLTGTPARLWPSSTWPTTSSTIRPVAYVDFVAGWATVPASVVTAIRLLAAHYYERRSETVNGSLTEVPHGFRSICEQYRTGLQGAYGEGY